MIKKLKDYFETEFSKELNLQWVVCPMFVSSESGLNHSITGGVDKPVVFEVDDLGFKTAEVILTVAKWKRLALQRYGFNSNEGLYTDMRAIRPNEKMSKTHSIFVDQWDWELIIPSEDRTIAKLQDVVKKIYKVFKSTEEYITSQFPHLQKKLPDEIFFITSEELLKMYPNTTPSERECKIVEKYKAVFISNIGRKLSNGEKHGGRSPSFDDWNLNGDIIFWNPVMNSAYEVSSMGIRVDGKSVLEQLKIANLEGRAKLSYYQDIINEKVPHTIGGGIGQTRTFAFLLGSKHVGEVQPSVWSDDIFNACRAEGIELL